MISELRNKTVLVVGADSTIGSELVIVLNDLGVDCWSTTRKKSTALKTIHLDLSDDSTSWLFPVKFNVVFLCAAITSIERCMLEPEFTRKVNVINTVALAKRFSNEDGSFVIFLSSTAVFDGSISFVNHLERINPRSEYGRQKAEAEALLLALNDRIAVVRLNKVISPSLTLFKNWINTLRSGKPIQPFYDMVMAPISLKFVMNLLVRISETETSGVIQASASEDISYLEAAEFLTKKVGLSNQLIIPISYRDKDISFSPQHTTFDSHGLQTLEINVPRAIDALDYYSIEGSEF